MACFKRCFMCTEDFHHRFRSQFVIQIFTSISFIFGLTLHDSLYQYFSKIYIGSTLYQQTYGS